MKRLLYIILSLVLTISCTKEPLDGIRSDLQNGADKVLIDFSVQIHDPSVATKALAETPKLRNLMVAVFDESGYLLEYTFATDTDFATDNGILYDYKVAITQSTSPRIIHFIGNAPNKLKFGVEEAVLAEISSSIGQNDDDGIYWCRRVIPQISGTQSGGIMLLSDDDLMQVDNMYQADAQTQAYFNNVGLIRNFSKIKLISSSKDFTLEKYIVIGTPKTGLAAAYNYNSREFVNYYKTPETPLYGSETTGYTYNLGTLKDFSEIINEGYDANVLPSAEKYTLTESSTESNWIAKDNYAYVYECEKPLKAEDAVYIIAYGTYSDGNKYYYKIDLRDANGYFPILRNFMYTIDITNVTRAGYESIDKAASSTGSGDISTSLETKSLAYISDGIASLEVEYIEKYIVTEGNVTMNYTFLSNVNNSTAGSANNMWIVVNEAGATGAAISQINGITPTVGERISVSSNPGSITITPTALTNAPKTQTITIFAEYINGDASHTLQRTVTFIVQSKRTMLVSLTPSEVPNVAGSEFDVNISLPAGLSKSIFPLEFLIESGSLSINPNNDQMPVRTGESLIGNGMSSFYFAKTLEYRDYNPESGAVNIVDCHFKTIRNEGATHIYVSNPYFNTEYDYNGTVSNEDAGGNSVYLDTYSPYKFSNLNFSSEPTVGVGEGVKLTFGFSMDRIPEDGIVYISLGNLEPQPNESQLEYIGLKNGKVMYSFRPTSTNGSLMLQTAHLDGDLSVDLEAYHFIPASRSVSRSKYDFNGRFSKDYLTGVAETVNYTFYLPYYYEGIIIEVEMKGLEFNPNNLPEDWDNWRHLGNNIYAVEYKPSGWFDQISMNLITTITSANEECSITLQSLGYNSQTSTIKVARDITIEAGKLITTLSNTNFADGGTISIYRNATDTTPIKTYTYTREQTGGYWPNYQYRRAYNTNEISLTGVSNGDVYTIKYGNYTGTFTITDNIETNGATVSLRN